MQKYQNFDELKKDWENLSPYEEFQLSRFGNILNNANPEGEETETAFTHPR